MADTIVVEYGVKHDILGLRPMTVRPFERYIWTS
jgi:hypothetical protein